jgi:hypothetical protein
VSFVAGYFRARPSEDEYPDLMSWKVPMFPYLFTLVTSRHVREVSDISTELGHIEQRSSKTNSKSCLKANVSCICRSWIWFVAHGTNFMGGIRGLGARRHSAITRSTRREEYPSTASTKDITSRHDIPWITFQMRVINCGVGTGPAEFMCADAPSLDAAK